MWTPSDLWWSLNSKTPEGEEIKKSTSRPAPSNTCRWYKQNNSKLTCKTQVVLKLIHTTWNYACCLQMIKVSARTIVVTAVHLIGSCLKKLNLKYVNKANFSTRINFPYSSVKFSCKTLFHSRSHSIWGIKVNSPSWSLVWILYTELHLVQSSALTGRTGSQTKVWAAKPTGSNYATKLCWISSVTFRKIIESDFINYARFFFSQLRLIFRKCGQRWKVFNLL